MTAPLLLPLGLLVLAAATRGGRWLPRTLGLAALPGLAAALRWRDAAPLVLDPDGLQLTLGLDRPRALLLGATALLWSLAGQYAGTYLRDDRQAGRFAAYWLLTLTGCQGVFLAGDLASFYLLYSLMSLAAYGLVVHDGTPAARRAAMVYLVLAVLGEAFLLIAFVLLHAASPGESLLIRDVVAALPESPHRLQTLIFLLLGFGLKMGLAPLHGWLPLAHPAAPMPASAVLSGAIVKTGVVGFAAFLPWTTPLPDAGTVLLAAGLFTAFYAVLMGVTQANPKTVLAYSTVSQMGLVAAVLGAGLGLGRGEAALAAAFYALHHVLVKGALFLAVGVAAKTPARLRWTVLAPCALLALSFAGLPLTGGMAAKLATKPWFADGLIKLLATLSASGSALLMLHFLRRLAALPAPDAPKPPPAGLVWPWAVAGVAAVVMPWALYGVMPGGQPGEAFTAKLLWSALWPVLAGALLAPALFRWGRALPAVPEGDVICYGERAAREVAAWSARAETADDWLRRWPAAAAAALALALALAALLESGGG